MTNTIPNVPRELLERVLNAGWGSETVNALDDLRGFLESAPSPAGVDGLEVATFLHTMHMEIGQTRQVCSEWKGDPFGVSGVDYSSAYSVTSEPLCRLSDAQATIDGLRGEVAQLQSMLATVSKAGIRVRTERDQQAQRIGELEAALEFACKSLAQVTSSDGSGHADIAVSVLRMTGRKEADASQIVEAYMAGAKWRIDAALSAGKDSAS